LWTRKAKWDASADNSSSVASISPAAVGCAFSLPRSSRVKAGDRSSTRLMTAPRAPTPPPHGLVLAGGELTPSLFHRGGHPLPTALG
jgi:hypothetical protein